MEETGHIDWSMAMENLRQSLGAAVVVADKEVERRLWETAV